MQDADDYPTAQCPKCWKETPDMDGFGFIACLPGCGYCRHVALTKRRDGLWYCDICEAPVTKNLNEVSQ